MQLIALPGFLGTVHDFDALLGVLPATIAPTVLPVYPDLQALQENGAVDFDSAIAHWFESNISVFENEFILLGYSLGARIATGLARYLQAYCSHGNKRYTVRALILESVNTGLRSTQLRMERAASDRAWSEIFAQQPLEAALRQWYEQPVFCSLSSAQKHTLITEKIEQKSQLSGRAICAQMHVFGLAKQPDHLEWLQTCEQPLLVISGEQDAKFTRIAQSIILEAYKGLAVRKLLAVHRVAPKCGHNVHFEAPAWYAKTVIEFLKRESLL